jgi:hypothetical protein
LLGTLKITLFLDYIIEAFDKLVFFLAIENWITADRVAPCWTADNWRAVRIVS